MHTGNPSTLRRGRTRLAALLMALVLPVTGLVVSAAEPAAAATDTGCSTADPGSGRYASTLCWFDFSGYDAAEATSPGGQEMSVSLPGGSTLTFTVRASGGGVRSNPFPTYSAAYLGNGSYTGVTGRPALYQRDSRTNTDVVLSDIVFTTPTGERSTAFSLVGADAESTDAGESIVWRSDNPIYSLTENGTDPGIGNACGSGFTGVGTQQVTCSANSSSRKTGTPILASQAPDTFSQRMVGGGRQAVAFGVLLSQVELNKQVDSRFPGDAFEIAIRDEDGTRLFDAATGATGTSATTEEQTVIATDRGATFQFSESATSGSLDRYTVSWACTRNGGSDPTLPAGRGVGAAARVQVGIGDFVSCTITNTAKPTALLLQKRASAPEDVNGNGIADAGDRITYTFDVTNTGELPMRDIRVDDPKIGAVTCPALPAGGLAPGEKITCTADAPYTATAQDQAEGAVHNTATATGTPVGTSATVTSNESSTSTPLTAPDPSLSLVKIATPHDAASFVAGQVISYRFVVTNTGNVPLRDVTVAETEFTGSGTAPTISCPDTSSQPLGVDRSMTCTASYTITQDDVNALPTPLRNTAEASGDPVGGGGRVTAPPATVEIPGNARPAIGLEKSVTPRTAHKAGDTVDYTFHVTNLGNVTLTDPSIDERVFSGTGGVPVAACPAGALNPGDSVDCTASYTLTQADIDAGAVDNTAVATATPPGGGTAESGDSSARVLIPRETGLTLEKTSQTTSYTDVGQRIDYSFVVTNTGNVSLSGVTVNEGAFSGAGSLSNVSCPADVLEGGASMTCTAEYTVQQADLDAGSIYNAATAQGTPAGSQEPVGAPPSDVTIPAEQRSALQLEKTADRAEASSGDRIAYRFRITNTGNVSVVNPQVEEVRFTGAGELSDVLCPQLVLAPGDSVDCAGFTEATDRDRAAGVIDNTAVATAHPPAGVGTPRSNESSARVKILNPAISLVKTADVERVTRAGQVVAYSFEITNTGNTTLTNPRVSEQEFTGRGTMSDIVCPAEAVLEPDQSVTCKAEYTVVAGDLTGKPLRNVATSSADDASGAAVVSNESRVELPTPAPEPSTPGTPPNGRDLAATGAQANTAIAVAAIVLLVLGAGAVAFGIWRRKRR